MKVNRIQQNYNLRTEAEKKQSNISFQKSGGVPIGDKIMDSLQAKKILKGMKKMEYLKGEAGGIAITAFGTGFVAPWPIAFNPFVKAPKGASKEEIEDLDKTKKYTAMRQIVSMVLSALFQLGALKPIDIFLDKLFNNPEYAKNLPLHLDLSVINNNSYIKTLAKKELKEQKKQLSSKDYEKALNAKIKELETKQVDDLAKAFKECGRIQIGDRFLDNKTLAELINKQVDSYIDDAMKLRIDHEKLAFYSKRAKTLMENENHLREIFDEKLVPKDPKEMKKFLNGLLSKETVPEVKELIEEILARPEDIQANRIQRTLSRIDYIKGMCNGTYSEKAYLESMSLRNGYMDEIITKLKLNKITDPKHVTDNGIRDAIEKITESCSFDVNNSKLKSILHDTDTFDFNKESLSKKIHKDITKQYKNLLKNKYKGVNQLIKIAVGVCITLPITCNALNWVYPRFMRIAFPGLAGVKDNKNKVKEDD